MRLADGPAVLLLALPTCVFLRIYPVPEKCTMRACLPDFPSNMTCTGCQRRKQSRPGARSEPGHTGGPFARPPQVHSMVKTLKLPEEPKASSSLEDRRRVLLERPPMKK